MAKKVEGSESSLSPAPEDLKTPAEIEGTVKTTANGRKRKAETVKTTAKATKRTKNGATEIKVEEEVTIEAAETPRKKRAATKKVKHEEEEDDQEDGADGETATVEKTVKKNKVTRAKKSKEPDPPLEERTLDTKLRIGAHVSVAGGELHTRRLPFQVHLSKNTH